jgi:hypothetical protein
LTLPSSLPRWLARSSLAAILLQTSALLIFLVFLLPQNIGSSHISRVSPSAKTICYSLSSSSFSPFVQNEFHFGSICVQGGEVEVLDLVSAVVVMIIAWRFGVVEL